MLFMRILMVIVTYGIFLLGPVVLICLAAILISLFIKKPKIRKFIIHCVLLLFCLSVAAVAIGLVILFWSGKSG